LATAKGSSPPRLLFVVFCCVRVVLLLLPLAPLHAQTQASINAEARADFQRADADLNKTYQSVLAKLPTVESKQKLREAQRAWVVFRDVEAAHAAKEADGGSMAPTLRYATMTHLTQDRIKELKALLDHGTESEPKSAASVTSSPAFTPESTSEQAQSVSESRRSSSSSASSVSPDNQWEYKCDEYGLNQCAPAIVKSGTTDVVVDLDQDLEVYNPEANQTEVIWAPDSKRFACNYAPVHAHHTRVEFIAFYQLRDGEWAALHSPSDIKTEDLQLAQLGKGHLPKEFNPRRCAPDNDVLKVRKWTDANTAILYAPCYGRTSGDLEAGFLFTLKFDDAGKWKIVDTRRMSKKELGAEQ
jgi:uncharacterized protein YecT (DUF1311 family)